MIETTAFGDLDGRPFGTVHAQARANPPVCKQLSRSGDRVPGATGEGPA